MADRHNIRLGVNIDHVATLRNARGGDHPDPVKAALSAQEAGADGITAHLREDRRHVSYDDVRRLKEEISIPLNLEMAATEEMQGIALDIRPNAVCLVPENREEVTTEGGLDVVGQEQALTDFIKPLKLAGMRISLFIDPDNAQVEAAARIGADIVEIHTGNYCNYSGDARTKELYQIYLSVTRAFRLGLEVHAGHGLDYVTVGPVASILLIKELNIGHFMMGQALYDGLDGVVKKMRRLMDVART